MKRIFASLALATVAAATFSQVDPNRVVISVNGEDIKGQEYYHRMEYLPDVGRVFGVDHIAIYPPGFLTAVQLIDERLLLQLAKQKGVYPQDQEVNEALQNSIKGDPKLEEKWMNSGRSVDELKEEFRFQVAQFKLQTQGVTVSDQEVTDWYGKNPPTIPRRATLRMIAVRTADDEKSVDTDLAAGKKFGDVAKEKSVDVTQIQDGEIGTVPIERMPAEVVAAIDTTKVGQVTKWVNLATGNVYAKYLIEDKQLPQKLDLDGELKERIRRKLMIDKGTVRNNVLDEVKEMRKNAKISFALKEWQDIYPTFVKTYLGG